MIIWRGWGVLALVIAGVCGGAGTLIAGALGVDTGEANVGTGLGALVAAVAIWFVGARLNAPRPGFDPNTGERVVYRNLHTFMFVPMQWLAPLVGVIGLTILFLAAFR